MKGIRKSIDQANEQIFEVCTSRKEFCTNVKDILWGEDTWIDEDGSLYLKYKSGKEISLIFGDKIPRINFGQIACGLYNNAATQMLYKLPIVFNAHYEDWEVAT